MSAPMPVPLRRAMAPFASGGGRRTGGGRRGAGARGARATRRVLIVDDEALVALTLEAIVQDMGHEVAGAAANPIDAVALAVRTDPDVVLMDVRLGRIGDEGIATAAEIRARTRAAIVFVTAYADGGTIARIEAAVPGARVLAKPVSDSELAEAIDAATATGS